MEGIGDIFKFFVDLARALFDAFAHAIVEYPFVSMLIVVVATLVYMKSRNAHVPIRAFGSQIYVLGKSEHRSIDGFVLFIASVIAANGFGWILNFILSVFSTIFGWGQTFVGPFGSHPVAFVAFLFAFILAGLAYIAVRERTYSISTLKAEIISVRGVVIGFLALFATYVFTNIYANLTLDDSKDDQSASFIPELYFPTASINYELSHE